MLDSELATSIVNSLETSHWVALGLVTLSVLYFFVKSSRTDSEPEPTPSITNMLSDYLGALPSGSEMLDCNSAPYAMNVIVDDGHCQITTNFNLAACQRLLDSNSSTEPLIQIAQALVTLHGQINQHAASNNNQDGEWQTISQSSSENENDMDDLLPDDDDDDDDDDDMDATTTTAATYNMRRVRRPRKSSAASSSYVTSNSNESNMANVFSDMMNQMMSGEGELGNMMNEMMSSFVQDSGDRNRRIDE